MERKERVSKMIASCRLLEDELLQCSKDGGVTMANGVETLGVDLRTRVKRLGVKEKARRSKCKVRFSPIMHNKVFQKSFMKVEVKMLQRAGVVPARTWRVHAVEMAPTERFQLQMAAAAGKKVQPRCPCSWKPLALKWNKSSLLWLLRLGQKGRGLANGTQNKKHGRSRFSRFRRGDT